MIATPCVMADGEGRKRKKRTVKGWNHHFTKPQEKQRIAAMVIYFLFSWGIWCGLSDECLDVWQPFRHFVTTKWLGSCVYGTSNIRYDDWACLIIFWLLFYFFSLSSFSLSILLKSIRFSFISIFLLHTLVLYIFFSLPLSVSSFSFFFYPLCVSAGSTSICWAYSTFHMCFDTIPQRSSIETGGRS